MNINITLEDNANVLLLDTNATNEQSYEELIEVVSQSINANKSVILDLSRMEKMDSSFIDLLQKMHIEFYNTHNLSFVICHVPKSEIIQEEEIEVLNITPTLIEALDIVNMEVIERELLGE